MFVCICMCFGQEFVEKLGISSSFFEQVFALLLHYTIMVKLSYLRANKFLTVKFPKVILNM